MKKLIIINGTMGVGKTKTCSYLYKKLDRSVWLDGDWCWMMNPWMVTDENKAMVEDNVIHLLKNYLVNTSFDYVIFDWVIHKEEIFDVILKGLQGMEFKLYKITLICSEQVLRTRMQLDDRDETAINQSIKRLDLYRRMNTAIIDTSSLSVPEAAGKIIELIH